MRIGVIGIRSKHLAFFRQALAAVFPEGEHTITHIWGQDAPEKLPELSGLTVCDTQEQLIGSVDAVIIALREGYAHAAPARRCLELGKPVFVDKPFTCHDAEAEALLALAAKTGTPCTGGSTIAMTKIARQLQRELPQCKEYSVSYQADLFSPYGGWYFYGSHLTDLCVTLFGTGWTGVSTWICEGCLQARVEYPEFSVTLCSSNRAHPPIVTADREYELDDIHCYEAGMAHFIAVAQGREADNLPLQVSSVKLMNAILTAAGAQPYPG